MEKYICIHGHFYQPPRENPWLEEIEPQDGAYPYHDWNEKITHECYKQNAASRILGSDKKIIDIVNNYAKISFDFGPTLLSWLRKHAPEVYQSILDADMLSQQNFSGHASAMAQVYNHMIMPLANSRDKITQIIWGIKDFELHFQRKPAGMWLSETAVDMETLELMAQNGIQFTVLAPHQAKRIRRIGEIGETTWQETGREKIDTTVAYKCPLPSGRFIDIFFYDHSLSWEIASGSALKNGEEFARKMLEILSKKENGLAHVANDGETFGHHFRHTDMALAYCLHYIESNNLAKVTNYAEFLEKFPPQFEVEINENTSWSCGHGIERWRDNCGCHFGKFPSGSQQWRKPLRAAMDWLSEQLAEIYEQKMWHYNPEVWDIRNLYIKVINDRSPENIQKFFLEITKTHLKAEDKVTILKLLEMQRHGMLMYTSCGWFFDDLTGIETIQIMQYAKCAMQYAKELAGKDLEPQFKKYLKQARCNVPEYSDGMDLYEKLVEPTAIDLNRVAAHLAVISLFNETADSIQVYCYNAKIENYEVSDSGIQTFATGRASIQSIITLEKHLVDFAVLHFGDHNIIAAITKRMSDSKFASMRKVINDSFLSGNTTEVIRLMNINFEGDNYSLFHLFKDEQRKILNQLLGTTLHEIEESFRHIYEHNFTIMQIMRGMKIPLPRAFAAPAEFLMYIDIRKTLERELPNYKHLKSLIDQAKRLSLTFDQTILSLDAARRINDMMKKFQQAPHDTKLLETIEKTLGLILIIITDIDLQTSQNILFEMSKTIFPDMQIEENSGSADAQKWIEHFTKLAEYLSIKV
jgi:alpha-amylase/alpha-mannosidase (GH57 family)